MIGKGQVFKSMFLILSFSIGHVTFCSLHKSVVFHWFAQLLTKMCQGFIFLVQDVQRVRMHQDKLGLLIWIKYFTKIDKLWFHFLIIIHIRIRYLNATQKQIWCSQIIPYLLLHLVSFWGIHIYCYWSKKITSWI